MAFNSIVNGPEMSRRFGRVLRLNLSEGSNWWREEELFSAVHAALTVYRRIDCIVISGGTEPTLHPRFATLVEGLCRIRARRARGVKLAIVSNGSTLHREDVRRTLSRLDLREMAVSGWDASVADIAC
jgi:wyosine [tRNA(Phe)-imidazoG37] synthetase (radical SAM superfamily)